MGCCDYDRGVSDNPPPVEARIPAQLAAVVEERVRLASEAGVAGRLRDGDASLWGPEGTPEISNRLGWLTIAERIGAELGALESLVAEVQSESIAHVVLLGMGGSSLAPEVLRRTFPKRAGYPQLHVLDSTDSATIRSIESTVDLKQTLFIVSSKSGGTIEPLSLFAHFHALVNDGAHFIAITDPGSGLAQLAAEHGFRATFLGDPNIGGRYSALSPFGIVPAALLGIDIRSLLGGAAAAWQTPLNDPSAQAPAERTPAAVWLGAALSALAQGGRDKLTFLISESLPGLGLWLEQLVAESTGKHGTGILPVADEPVGEPADYGDDRVFAYLPDLRRPDATLAAQAQALAAAGHPLITIATDGPEDLGRVFMLAELAVAVAGWGLQINPFDQPNVQQAKDATKRVLDEFETVRALPDAPSSDAAAVCSMLLEGDPPEYLAIMAYLEPSIEFDEAAAELREAVRTRTKLTSTFGYGPRFLHSTGQFHKGGPATGRFLQLLHDGPEDAAIPGAAYDFTTLKNAQAIGDLNTLRELGRPAERLRLEGEDPVRALRALTATLKEST